ncbi:TfoX/Sxy family protein [Streptococcus dentiloxodontae]
MVSSKHYLNNILEQLSELEELNYRAMMGEYILYYKGKIIGGIYDNRLLVKPVPSALSYLPEAVYDEPYAGAKDMLLVDDTDDAARLTALFKAMYEELPAPKKKK